MGSSRAGSVSQVPLTVRAAVSPFTRRSPHLPAGTAESCSFPASLQCSRPGRSGSADSHHELYLMCDTFRRPSRELKKEGIEFTREVSDEGFGLMTALRLPGGGELALYDESGSTASLLLVHKSRSDEGADRVPADACCSTDASASTGRSRAPPPDERRASPLALAARLLLSESSRASDEPARHCLGHKAIAPAPRANAPDEIQASAGCDRVPRRSIWKAAVVPGGSGGSVVCPAGPRVEKSIAVIRHVGTACRCDP